ncbi:MAG TPA: flagellar hook-associated protein FlgK [Aliiroseovarius sp.]|nr:flagellar hook-associated protein FlgK [Aliiroseovarius sp.]
MSISTTLFNSLTGLNAASRAAELVSSNVANSMTEGYGVRSLELSSRTVGLSGTGVHVDGVVRNVDEVLIENRRLAQSAVSYGDTLTGFLKEMEQVIGTPDQPGSLSDRIAAFESSLISASSNPASDARLVGVLNTADDLVTHLKSISSSIQAARVNADRDIGAQVDTLNKGLKNIEQINISIQESLAHGKDPSALMDLRQSVIDDISSIVPLRQVPRANGKVALFTPGGAILLDGRAAEIGFSRTATIVPEMTLAGGALSGLTINGNSVETAGARSPVGGGSLAALFEIRDEAAVSAQVRLDAVARDLVERFQDPALDATRAPGDPGLFTDAGAVFASGNEVALSSRLALNAAVDPDQAGAVWRLRDGLGAAAPGDVGDGRLLADLTGALTAGRIASSGGFSAMLRDSSTLASEFLSGIRASRDDAELSLSHSAARSESLKLMELETGVDTDAEMQKLLLIEQAYAANAKVMTSADEMIQLLLQI